jgi:site-specific recombinase XerD
MCARSRPRFCAGGRHLVFLNTRGARLSRVGFWKLLKEYGARAACLTR